MDPGVSSPRINFSSAGPNLLVDRERTQRAPAQGPARAATSAGTSAASSDPASPVSKPLERAPAQGNNLAQDPQVEQPLPILAGNIHHGPREPDSAMAISSLSGSRPKHHANNLCSAREGCECPDIFLSASTRRLRQSWSLRGVQAERMYPGTRILRAPNKDCGRDVCR